MGGFRVGRLVLQVGMAALLQSLVPVGVSADDGADPTSKQDKASGRELMPVEGRAERFGVSEPVRDMPAAPLREIDPYLDPREIRNPAIRRVRKAPIRREAGVAGSPDQALSPAVVPNVMDPPLVTFEALNNFQSGQLIGGFVYPPDTNGDIGPNHYVQTVNLVVRVFNRNGTPASPTFLMSSLFAGLGGVCATTDDGDPIVLYDHLADRWLISQFALPNFPNPPFHQCVAVSQTGDPTGAYYAWDFVMPGANLNDYPHFGVWPDAYYMTDNQFLAPGLAFNGAGAFAFDRTKLLAGDPAASFIYFDLSLLDPNLGGMLPSDLDGPPRVRPNVFSMFTATEFGDPQGDALRLFEFTPNFVTPASSTFVELPFLPVAAFDPISPAGRADIPQPGTAIRLDSIGDRLMHRLQYRNFGTHESLVVTHTVDASGNPTAAVYRAAPRYYELRRALPGGAWTVREQATFAPADTVNRWMGSAAMDNDGNLAVGYSVSDATVTFPGIRYAGRLAADPLGGLAQGEATLQNGSGVQTGAANRWGDYSMLAVDPADDCTFWYTTEYYSNVNPGCTGGGATICWQTRVGSFKFASCTAGPANGTLTVGDATVTEGDVGSVDASFTVTLTPASSSTVTVNYSTANGTATAGSDYTATAGPLTFLAGQTTQFVLVPVIGDTLDEDNETFTVNLSGAIGATVADGVGLGTITDNDAPPTLGISDVSQAEGTGGTTSFAFAATLSAASGKTITVNADTADGTAIAPGDYATRSAVLTFPPGTTTMPFAVDVVGDPVIEADETFFVNLSGATNATIADGQGVATLVNDDSNYFTVTPCRLADTRSTTPPALVAGASRNFQIGGLCGIPADARAVAFNLTVTESTIAGFLSLHPTGQPLPVVSSINFVAGVTRANNAIIPLGTGGQIAVFNGMASGTVHLVLDVTGYFR